MIPAAAIVAEARAERLDPALALAVATVENGGASNPMGVRSCDDGDNCIRIGVRSLAHRLRVAHGNISKALCAYHTGRQMGGRCRYATVVIWFTRHPRPPPRVRTWPTPVSYR